MAARVVGFKVWWADGTRSVIRLSGRSRIQVGNDVTALPATGLQVVILYYDEFSVDGLTRYRRILQGNDYYYVFYDDTPPPQLRDWAFGQTNNVADTLTHVGSKVMTGSQVSDLAYKTWVDAAMGDFQVSEFGLTPVGGTQDT